MPSYLGICEPSLLLPPTSELGCGTGHLSTAISTAFHVARTLAVHLALVLAEAERGEVHTGAGALLFWVDQGEREVSWEAQTISEVWSHTALRWLHHQQSGPPELMM